MKHDIPVERLLELIILRDALTDELQTIAYYEFNKLEYNSPYNLDKMRSRINYILDEVLDEYKIENYANLTESKG